MTSEPGDAFEALYGPIDSLAIESVVEQLYRNTLDRTPDTGGLASWTKRIEGNLAHHEVVFLSSESAEYQANTAALITTLQETSPGIWDLGPWRAALRRWGRAECS